MFNGPVQAFSPAETLTMENKPGTAELTPHLAQKLSAIFGRARSAHSAEHPCKVLLRFEAAGHRNVQDTRLGGAQHFLRALDSLADNKLMRALARRLAKHLREMSRAQPR